MFDITKARRDTPASEHIIHFNNAGSALPPQVVTQAMIEHLQLEARVGGYEAAAINHDQLERPYDALATLLNCHRDEIAVVENATRAWDMAFYGIPFSDGDRILTSMSEYASNYIGFLQMKKRVNVTIEVIPNDEHGQVDVDALRKMMDERVKLVAISHIPTNGGLVQPAKAIGEVVADYPAYYLLDATQSVGQYPVDVDEIGCHMLAATGRKYLRGARGIGFLYVQQEVIPQIEPPLLDIHAAMWDSPTSYTIRADARRFENWEANFVGKIGLGVAVDYALSWEIETIWERVSHLAKLLRQQLSEIDQVTVRDLGQEQCGIVTFDMQSIEAKTIVETAKVNNININISPKYYTLLDMQQRNLHELLRSSVHYYNTEDEIAQFVEVIKTVTI